MFSTLRTFGSALIGLVLFSGSAWAAGGSVIEGIVKDPKGQAVKGADVRVEGAGRNNSVNKIVKTDAKGHYLQSGLEVGTYRVSLLVEGSVKASINNVKAKLGEPTQLNFDLQPAGVAKKKPSHMVYVPSETGTHMGGRWVEVNDNGEADTVNVQNVRRAGAGAVGKLQSNSGSNNPAGN